MDDKNALMFPAFSLGSWHWQCFPQLTLSNSRRNLENKDDMPCLAA
jgi:hypothetical protein